MTEEWPTLADVVETWRDLSGGRPRCGVDQVRGGRTILHVTWRVMPATKSWPVCTSFCKIQSLEIVSSAPCGMNSANAMFFQRWEDLCFSQGRDDLLQSSTCLLYCTSMVSCGHAVVFFVHWYIWIQISLSSLLDYRKRKVWNYKKKKNSSNQESCNYC